MIIKTFTEINSPTLKANWQYLQEEAKAFPQMYYEWVAPWWEQNKIRRTLHIVVVYNESDEPVGLAPFCIQREFGIKVLNSIPIHFGDFYHFFSLNQESLQMLIEYVKSMKHWHAVKIFNCNNFSATFKALNDQGFKSKKVVDILSPRFKGQTFEQFLKTISKNSRNQYKKKLRRLNKEGKVEFVAVNTWNEYKQHFEYTKALYNMRWEGDDRPLLSDTYYKQRNQALQPLFKKKKAVMYLLKLNQEVIAFRLGFLSGNIFFDWKVSHNPKFNYYSPGFLTVGLIIEHLINEGYSEFNFMTGNYQYKRSWTNNDASSANYELLFSKSFVGHLYTRYRMDYRDKIKAIAKKMKLA